jgi:hypothetical protein
MAPSGLKTNRFEVPTFQRLFLMLKLKPSDVRVADRQSTKG